MKFEWEEITAYEARAMVPGGWLVKSITWIIRGASEYQSIPEQRPHVSMHFVPDLEHLWKIDK